MKPSTAFLSILAASGLELASAMPYPNGSFDAILALLNPNSSVVKTAHPPFRNHSMRAVQAPFLNHTLKAVKWPSLNRTGASTPCVPFEDPHCCVDRVVCMCENGTFFMENNRTNQSRQLCAPPSSVQIGEDTSNIPGWCC
ncbi:hypothetical protein F5B20DRAFT_579211 [Whalleya microplaca]|nr:hypothetical protein F5B20DRAFT_579211 [Whalleya microplaca]